MKLTTTILAILLCATIFGQNKIKIRKSDTTFNAFYYSESTSPDTYSNAFQGGQKGSVVFSKKCRSYYILREDGSVFFFNDKPNYRKIKKKCDNVDWSILSNTNGKYYITDDQIVIFPYKYTETGEKVLGNQFLEGKFNTKEIIMNLDRAPRVMIKFEK